MNEYLFKYTEYNERPPTVQRLKGGKVRVARNIQSFEREGETFYSCEMAIMSESAYTAYEGAREVALKREADIVDETILTLIEEGSL